MICLRLQKNTLWVSPFKNRGHLKKMWLEVCAFHSWIDREVRESLSQAADIGCIAGSRKSSEYPQFAVRGQLSLLFNDLCRIWQMDWMTILMCSLELQGWGTSWFLESSGKWLELNLWGGFFFLEGCRSLTKRVRVTTRPTLKKKTKQFYWTLIYVL